MKFTRTSPIIIPVIIFAFFFVVTISKYFVLHEAEANTNYLSDHIFYYVINVFTWLSGAFLLNVLITMFLWGGLGKPKSTGADNYLIDFISMLTYSIALLGIATFTIGRQIDTSWIVTIVLFLIIGTFLRRKILSLFKGTFFSTESPYAIGDWIELKGAANILGEVIDISRRATKLKTEDGAIAVIPNQLLYDEIIINYSGTKKEIKVQFELTLDFSISIERAKRIIHVGVKDTTYFSTLSLNKDLDILVVKTNDLGVVYSIGVWIQPWEDLSPSEVKDLFYSSILKHLSYAGITLAYPKNDIYYDQMPTRISELNSVAGIKDVLSKNELLNPFSEDEIEQIAGKVHLAQFSKGDILITQDADGDSMFIMVEGLVEVLTKNEQGIEITLGTVSPGQYFGEMSLLTGDPRSASVRAVTDTALCEIKKEHLQNILNERPEIVELLSRTILDRRESNIQKIEQATNTKDSLYKEVLVKIKTFFKI